MDISNNIRFEELDKVFLECDWICTSVRGYNSYQSLEFTKMIS